MPAPKRRAHDAGSTLPAFSHQLHNAGFTTPALQCRLYNAGSTTSALWHQLSHVTLTVKNPREKQFLLLGCWDWTDPGLASWRISSVRPTSRISCIITQQAETKKGNKIQHKILFFRLHRISKYLKYFQVVRKTLPLPEELYSWNFGWNFNKFYLLFLFFSLLNYQAFSSLPCVQQGKISTLNPSMFPFPYNWELLGISYLIPCRTKTITNDFSSAFSVLKIIIPFSLF